jgi:hypothetical protein
MIKRKIGGLEQERMKEGKEIFLCDKIIKGNQVNFFLP